MLRRTRVLRVRTLPLYLRALRRPALSGRPSLGRLDDRVVFVFGSPRSGTTFLAGAIGSLDGFVDLGEVNPLKAAIPDVEARDVRRILDRVRRWGLVGSRRAVEQTPEVAFVLPAVARAFPRATLVHALRDGRDVVCSLLERGWLSAGRAGADDAGASYGRHPRPWVERGRQEEFRAASDARRCAWAWRRYVSAVFEAGVPVTELRYEQMAGDPRSAAATLAAALSVDAHSMAPALSSAHASSVGRWQRDLTVEQLADVEAEADALLNELGYV
jgi:Sulfotransferase family